MNAITKIENVETTNEETVMVNINNSNDEIREALEKKGVKVSKNWNRATLIRKAEEAKVWVQIKRSVVPDSYKSRYGKAQNCGDELASLLADAGPDEVASIAAQNGIDLGRWAGKNNGMIRMNLGNVLRGRLRRGEYLIVGNEEFNKEAEENAA